MTLEVTDDRLTPGLRATLQTAAESAGVPLRALTVLSPQNDPFRLDTPAHRRDGAWLADTVDRLGLDDRLIHLRGMHYMVIGQPKPNGKPYTNTDADWLWLSGNAAKAARFLGYIDFDQIVDNRNAAPVTRLWTPPDPAGYVSVDVDIELPDPEDFIPWPYTAGFVGRQPYKLALIGEKSSLEPILGPVAADYGADLYLPTGEISDTQIHTLAKIGAEDGRKIVVFYFADCDPAGHQMSISVGRKLQAFRAGLFPDLDFELFRVALTPDQVKQHHLPSTPLKAEEKRADRWMASHGVQQTEIDALAALNPALLDRMARDALDPFFDHTLARRVSAAHAAWTRDAEGRVAQLVGPEQLAAVRDQAAEQLDRVREQVAGLDGIRIELPDGVLPEVVVPEPMACHTPTGLVDSAWSFADQCAALIASKNYTV